MPKIMKVINTIHRCQNVFRGERLAGEICGAHHLFVFAICNHPGRSQEELAKRVGVSQAAIAQYETGASVPRLYVTVKIANALSVKIDELVNGKEDGNEST